MHMFLPCDAPFMRSFLLIPAMAALTLALTACEVQPVVTSGTPPATTTVTPVETAPTQTATSANSGEAVDVSSATAAEAETIPEAVTEAETAIITETPATEGAAPAAVEETAAEETPAEEAGTESLATTETAEPSGSPSSTKAGDAEADVADDSAPAVTELAMAAPPPPPPPPPPPELTPSSLLGLSSATLRTRLGTADFTRREGQMETWQYRLEMCIVDYFLFPKEDGQEIVSWAWRAPMVGETFDALACRRALAARDSGS